MESTAEVPAVKTFEIVVKSETMEGVLLFSVFLCCSLQ